MCIGQTEDGHVFIQFESPLRHLGFTPEQARTFASKLIEQADLIERGIRVRTQ